eukprot:CAMPEP_0114229464 /NCGR_PEP_ID=MMETSP0058-20121206/2920_1 /TAXON_ID=36894 /ORGANISM="Pyramimonas parkeae, CCMP726" /LENGTH=136 /DNA_ID=CAMNT_0001340539 /DNA_START=590 /DNA_END=1000 /DNA_ORIENTATION=+
MFDAKLLATSCCHFVAVHVMAPNAASVRHAELAVAPPCCASAAPVMLTARTTTMSHAVQATTNCRLVAVTICTPCSPPMDATQSGVSLVREMAALVLAAQSSSMHDAMHRVAHLASPTIASCLRTTFAPTMLKAVY